MEKENEINAAENRMNDKEVVKYTVKDSVFTNLFQDKEYLIQLYQTLHPEDVDVTEDELTDITIHNILTDDIYNDLGFSVGDRLLILVEAQASWSVNIIMRSLMYLMKTYQDYFTKTKQNIYKSKKVEFPKPELYVLFTGERKDQPEYISLAKEFFGGEDVFLDVKVKVLYGSGEDDIISQYVTFTKVYNEQMKIHGRTRKAILETIRICKDKNVLKKYLEEREKEVVSIMLAMLDEEEILLSYIESERYEAEQEGEKRGEKIGEKRGEKRGEKIGEKKADKRTAIQLLKMGKLSVEEIVQCIPSLSIEDVEQIQQELLQNV